MSTELSNEFPGNYTKPLVQLNMDIIPKGIKFPESVSAIVGLNTDINGIFNTKRPTVIEERRKTL